MSANAIYRFEELRHIADKGGVFVLKIDGERDQSKSYSVVLTGGGLGDNEYFHRDGGDLKELIDDAISHYYVAIKK